MNFKDVFQKIKDVLAIFKDVFWFLKDVFLETKDVLTISGVLPVFLKERGPFLLRYSRLLSKVQKKARYYPGMFYDFK
jgi:hypothetical protein